MTSAPHISNSQLEMYQKCGVQYEFVYEQGLRRAPNRFLHRGSAVDDAVSDNLRHKRDTGEELPLEQVEDLARDSVVKRVQSEGLRLLDGEGGTEEQTEGRIIDESVQLAGLHRKQVSPLLDPELVQERIEIQPAGFSRTLVGVLDLATKDGAVEDTKTAGKTPAKAVADGSQQLTMYDLLYQARMGKRPTNLRLRTLVLTDSGKTSVVDSPTERTDSQRQAYLDRIGRAVQGIEAGIFVPTNEGNWWCSARWCGFHDICPFVRK